MNNSESGNVAQKSEKEVSSEADIIDNHDDQDGIDDFDDDGEIESVLDADFPDGAAAYAHNQASERQ
jgi:hypothetical protein